MTLLLAALLGAAPELELPDCEGVDAAEVQRTLAVELKSAPATRLAVTCEGSRAHITAGALERQLELSGVAPEARSRTLAVSIAELALLSTRSTAAAPRPERPGSRLLAEGTALLAGRGLFLFGGGLRWSWERPEYLGLEVDARLEHGMVTIAAATLNADRFTLGVAGHARWQLGRVVLRGLTGLRGGAARLYGQLRDSGDELTGTGISPWLGFTLGVAASVTLGPVSLELGLDAGVPLIGSVARVDGDPVVALNGFSGGLRLGVGIFP